MSPDTSLLFALSALGLLLVLVALVLLKRFARSRAERLSLGRRARWLAALGDGGVPAMRMGELRALARQASRRLAAQDDLLTLLGQDRLPPRDARAAPFERALLRDGLGRALERACGSRRPMARGRAALLWARLGLHGAEAAIAPLLGDRDPDVRAAATQALALCRSGEAARALLRALRDGQVEPERVVERLAGAWATDPLLEAFGRPDFRAVRPWLSEALGLTGDPRAEDPLLTLLASPDEEQRIRACRALGRLGRPSSATALLVALRDGAPAVRAQAARSLGVLRHRRAISALAALMDDESWWVRGRAAEALRALGPSGIAALRACAARHADPFARERAAEALALHGVLEAAA